MPAHERLEIGERVGTYGERMLEGRVTSLAPLDPLSVAAVGPFVGEVPGGSADFGWQDDVMYPANRWFTLDRVALQTNQPMTVSRRVRICDCETSVVKWIAHTPRGEVTVAQALEATNKGDPEL